MSCLCAFSRIPISPFFHFMKCFFSLVDIVSSEDGCPNLVVVLGVLYCDQAETRPRRVCRHGTVNGIFCTDILVDTGATKTLVRKELVSNEDILDGETTIRCAHGDIVSYPLAAALGGRISSPRQQYPSHYPHRRCLAAWLGCPATDEPGGREPLRRWPEGRRRKGPEGRTSGPDPKPTVVQETNAREWAKRDVQECAQPLQLPLLPNFDDSGEVFFR